MLGEVRAILARASGRAVDDEVFINFMVYAVACRDVDELSRRLPFVPQPALRRLAEMDNEIERVRFLRLGLRRIFEPTAV